MVGDINSFFLKSRKHRYFEKVISCATWNKYDKWKGKSNLIALILSAWSGIYKYLRVFNTQYCIRHVNACHRIWNSSNQNGAFEMFHTCRCIKWLNLKESFTIMWPTYLITAQCLLHLVQKHLHGQKHNFSPM